MHLRTAILVLPLVGMPLLAWADIPPPNETCTLPNAEDAGASCQECNASYASDPCAAMFAGTGYTLVCKTSGASAWTEIWCATPDAGSGVVDAGNALDGGNTIIDAGSVRETPDAWFPIDPVPSKSNCGSSAPVLLPLPGLAWLLRRRRSRRS